MLKILTISALLIIYNFSYILSENCLVTDPCEHTTIATKLKFFSSPLANGCNSNDYPLLTLFNKCSQSKFSNCGYKGDPCPDHNDETGINIGLNLDLAQVDQALLTNAKVDKSIVEIISPFLGLKGKAAEGAMNNKNLTLTTDQANNLTDTITKYYYEKLSEDYNNDKCATCVKEFSNLNANIKASLLSFYYQHHGIKAKNKDIWSAITNNKWDSLISLIEGLRHPQLTIRAQALSLRSLSNKCNKFPTDTLFVYGNEGLYYIPQFESLRKYFLNYFQINTFPNNRINLATATNEVFTPVLDHFSLSKEELTNIVDNSTTFPFIQQKYDMSYAIEQGIHQFKQSGNNTKKTIVLVGFRGDGGVFADSWNNIRIQADIARANGISVISVAQDYNDLMLSRMQSIVETKENMIINNGDYIDSNFLCTNVTLNSKICDYFSVQNEIKSSNTTVSGHVSDFGNPVFYRITRNSNGTTLPQITLTPPDQNLRKDAKVNFFVGIENLYPDIVMNDVAHLGRNEGNKIVTLKSGDYKSFYIGVYADDLKYQITYDECVPNNTTCKTGTNDIEPFVFPIWLIIIIVVMSILLLLGIIYAIFKFKKSKLNQGHDHFTKVDDKILPN